MQLPHLAVPIMDSSTSLLKEGDASVKTPSQNLDMALGEPHIERALGVQWCVVSDKFQFRVVVKENLLTQRGVLSKVASAYDPLGFVAPFILVGKQILQQMCCDKLSWGDTLSDHLRPLWEFWLQDLKNLAGVNI